MNVGVNVGGVSCVWGGNVPKRKIRMPPPRYSRLRCVREGWCEGGVLSTARRAYAWVVGRVVCCAYVRMRVCVCVWCVVVKIMYV